MGGVSTPTVSEAVGAEAPPTTATSTSSPIEFAGHNPNTALAVNHFSLTIFSSIAREIDHVALVGEEVADVRGDVAVVFDHEDAHGSTLTLGGDDAERDDVRKVHARAAPMQGLRQRRQG